MKRSHTAAVSTSALALALGMGGQASAQDATVVTDESTLATDTTQNMIVVTDSRIERTIEESAVPIQVLGADDLDESGTTDLAEAVLQLPGVSESISPQSSNSLIQMSYSKYIRLFFYYI